MNTTRLNEIKSIVEKATLGAALPVDAPQENDSLKTSANIHHASDGLPRSLAISYNPLGDGNVLIVMNYAGEDRTFRVTEGEDDETIGELAYSYMAELLGP